jgi:arogenate/prephenate dehydratase
MLVAFQGEPGAYSEAAALKYAPGAAVLPCPSFEEVFAAVAGGRATHGILPMENSIGGTIHRNYDLMLEHELPIVGEIELRVDHCLLALPGTVLADVRVVYSHPQALAQCEIALAQMQGVEVVAVYDTAGAAKMVREGTRRDSAAVASRRAAEVFALDILRESIQDYPDNITRFCAITRPPAEVTGANKTSIVFALQSKPGALFKALAGFALRDINLTKLESRPLRGRPWEYAFYVDVEVPESHPGCQRALADLAEFSHWVRTLGSYPSSKS